MEDLDNITFDAFERYFAVLESVGYVTEGNTNKLLLLQFLQEFLQEYIHYITEEDYNIIEEILQCLAGTSCLIPYREYQQLSQPLTEYIYNIPFKVTQESNLRYTEMEENLRLVNQ